MKKQIRYRLGVSRVFPKTHPRAGEKTFFKEHILTTLMSYEKEHGLIEKLHTIRSNYPLWEKRMKKVQAGEAVIELFYWEDKPYNSKQVVFATLDKDSGCGVQRLIEIKEDYTLINSCTGINIRYDLNLVSKNDGLSFEDFKAWFKGYDLSKPLVIIQFTNLRY